MRIKIIVFAGGLLSSCTSSYEKFTNFDIPNGIGEYTEVFCDGESYRAGTQSHSSSYNEATDTIDTISRSSRGTVSPISRQIRFNEGAGEVWYRGADTVAKLDEAGDWVPALSVDFAPEKITAVFEGDLGQKANFIARGVTSMGVSFLLDKSGAQHTGVLNRVTGTWSVDDSYVISCVKADLSKRVF